VNRHHRSGIRESRALGRILAVLAALLVALSPLRHGTAVGLVTLVAVNDSYGVRHDRTLTVAAPGVLANDVGIGGGATAVLNAGPAHAAQFSLATSGGVSYRPVAGFVGTDTFTYHAHALLDSTVATVTISVTNAMPMANDDAYLATTGFTLSVPAPGVLSNDTDGDGDALTAEIVDEGGNGSLDLNPDGSFTFTSGGSYSGDRTFTYRVSDGVATSPVATVTITVSAKPGPTPAPTPAATATPSPSALPIPLPTLPPIPTILPIPSFIPLPTELPGPTQSTDPGPTPTAAPAGSPDPPTASGTGIPPAGGGGSTAGGAKPPTTPQGHPAAGALGDDGLELDGAAPFDGLDALGVTGFGGFDWAVPSLVLSVPGLLLVLALSAQGGVGLLSIPFVRRKLGGFGLRRGRGGEARTA
jgi:hypothetical protein